jgi:hypothetical protein
MTTLRILPFLGPKMNFGLSYLVCSQFKPTTCIDLLENALQAKEPGTAPMVTARSPFH